MYVYILECSDKSYYIGVTNNIERRYKGHQEGINRNCYTFTRGPLKLVLSEMFNDPDSTIAFEKKTKGWTRRKKEAPMKRDFHLLPEFSRSKHPQGLRQAQTDPRPNAGSILKIRINKKCLNKIN